MFSRLSYRTKMTLAFSLLVLLGVVSLGGLLLYTGYNELREDRIATGARMTVCLAKNIARDIEADDLYRVFESVNRFREGWSPDQRPEIVVVDRNQRIFVTSVDSPREYLSRPLAALGEQYRALPTIPDNAEGSTVVEGKDEYVALMSVRNDGHRLGTLIVKFSLRALQLQYQRLLRIIVVCGFVLLAVLWLIAWLLGKRMVQPLVKLTGSMKKVGDGDLNTRCELRECEDEFAALGRGFEDMLAGLREKKALESEFVNSERLAAIGRVSAGMAHEINNPLGGMLNAIDTYRKHGDSPQVAEKTIDLVNRGLIQLRNTVQALLVNARLEDRALSRQDIADVSTLVEPQARRKQVRMRWICELDEPSGVPSSQLRQVLINLVLNALQVTPPHGEIQVSCNSSPEHVVLQVEDSGPGIPRDVKEHLFEPFSEHAQGSGLGLWVSFQIVSGLGGSIVVTDREPGTRFVVTLPRGSHLAEELHDVRQ